MDNKDIIGIRMLSAATSVPGQGVGSAYMEQVSLIKEQKDLFRVYENKEKGLANIIVAGESYGQGSSREHAALCPMYLGVKAVIAKSIERIHRANLINFGIVPFTFADPKDADKVSAGDTLELKGIRAAVAGDGVLEVKAKGEGEERTFMVKTSLSDRERHLILCGGLLASL